MFTVPDNWRNSFTTFFSGSFSCQYVLYCCKSWSSAVALSVGNRCLVSFESRIRSPPFILFEGGRICYLFRKRFSNAVILVAISLFLSGVCKILNIGFMFD